MHEMLYEELRQTEKEILRSLQKKDNPLKTILEEELADIRAAMKKVESGCFGLCEISGELMPDDILKRIPTIKSYQDIIHIQSYCRKPLPYGC